MKKELKIIVSKPMSFAGTDYSKHESLIKAEINKDNEPISGVGYLHGKLEQEMGYDIFAILNGQDLLTPEKDSIKPGIYECSVVGYPRKCKGFFWLTDNNLSRGLVVDSEDSESLDYAESAFQLRRDFL